MTKHLQLLSCHSHRRVSIFQNIKSDDFVLFFQTFCGFDMRVIIVLFSELLKRQDNMGLFKERRPSLPVMTMKTEDLESEAEKVETIDREFVTGHQLGDGVEISVGLEETSRHQCLLRLQPCDQDPTLYTLRLASNIPSWPLKTSCTAR